MIKKNIYIYIMNVILHKHVLTKDFWINSYVGIFFISVTLTYIAFIRLTRCEFVACQIVRPHFTRLTSGAVSTRLSSWDISSLYCRILRMSVRLPTPSSSLSCNPIIGVRSIRGFPRCTRTCASCAPVGSHDPHQLLLYKYHIFQCIYFNTWHCYISTLIYYLFDILVLFITSFFGYFKFLYILSQLISGSWNNKENLFLLNKNIEVCKIF